MTLSNHRRLPLEAVFSGEPDSVTVFAGSVMLRYGDHKALVRRSDWRVYVPWDTEEADFLTSLGVGDRARQAVENREGRWLSTTPGPEFRMAQEAFRRRLGF